MKNKALGMVETYGYVGAIEAIDVCLKSANVEFVNYECVRGGLVTILITGDVGAVNASIDAAKTAVEKIGRLISTHVIPRPNEDMARIFSKIDVKESVYRQINNGNWEEGILEEIDFNTKEATVIDDESQEGKKIENSGKAKNNINEICVKSREKLKSMKAVDLRKLARDLDDKYEQEFPIDRGQIKYSRKNELIDGIIEYYERVK